MDCIVYRTLQSIPTFLAYLAVWPAWCLITITVCLVIITVCLIIIITHCQIRSLTNTQCVHYLFTHTDQTHKNLNFVCKHSQLSFNLTRLSIKRNLFIHSYIYLFIHSYIVVINIHSNSHSHNALPQSQSSLLQDVLLSHSFSLHYSCSQCPTLPPTAVCCTALSCVRTGRLSLNCHKNPSWELLTHWAALISLMNW